MSTTMIRKLMDIASARWSEEVEAARTEVEAIEKDLKKAQSVARVARQLYNDGQLDKYPTSDASPEYKLWRLVNPKETDT